MCFHDEHILLKEKIALLSEKEKTLREAIQRPKLLKTK